MKYILLISIFLSVSYANYNYTNENSGKIDMHGGKSDKLLGNKNSFSNKSLNSLGTISKPKNPVLPKKPKSPKKEENK